MTSIKIGLKKHYEQRKYQCSNQWRSHMAGITHNLSVDKPVKIESLTLDDGRKAERHITVDSEGNEVVEIFAEEPRPLKLEKRILREYKNIVSKETHEIIKDGEVSFQEVRSLEPETPIQVRSRIGLADHAKIVDGDYVRKEEINQLISDGVVAGVSALMDHIGTVPTPTKQAPPLFRAQELVEKNVEEKKKNDLVINIIMGVVVVAQIGLFYFFFM